MSAARHTAAAACAIVAGLGIPLAIADALAGKQGWAIGILALSAILLLAFHFLATLPMLREMDAHRRLIRERHDEVRQRGEQFDRWTAPWRSRP